MASTPRHRSQRLGVADRLTMTVVVEVDDQLAPQSSGLEGMRSRVEVETDLAPLQSQTRFKGLPGLRLEALEQRAATLS